MSKTKTIHVPHLGGIDAGYQLAQPYDASKPTVILVNSFTTSSELYKAQFQNGKLTAKMNLIAIELLGHGQTQVNNLSFPIGSHPNHVLQPHKNRTLDLLGHSNNEPPSPRRSRDQKQSLRPRNISRRLDMCSHGFISSGKGDLPPSHPIPSLLLTYFHLDRRHPPPRNINGLRIPSLPLSRLLGLPRLPSRHNRRLDITNRSNPRFRTYRRVL